jgi:hypothetical protein
MRDEVVLLPVAPMEIGMTKVGIRLKFLPKRQMAAASPFKTARKAE